MRQLKIGSLFSGYGGLDMAVESVTGARTAWVSDIDKGACKILAHRYPDVPNLGDLTQIDWSAVEPVDIIAGGFPCQDLSHAGKGAGMTADSRSGLWSYMCEAINIIRPRLVVAENVRGLLSAEALRPVESCTWCVGDEPDFDVRALGAVLADLADIGYDASWYGLRAADVGACHGRWRCFVVAYPDGSGRGEQRRPFPVRPQLAPAQHDRPDASLTRAQVFAGDWGDWPSDDDPALLKTPTTTQRGTDADAVIREGAGPNLHNAVHLLPTPAVNDMGRAYTPDEWDAWTDKMKAAHGNGNGHGKSLEIEAARLLPTPRAGDGEKGGPNQAGSSGDRMMPSAVHHEFGQYADAIARWESVIGRPAPSPTEPTGRGGAQRLSPAFTEWMMGLPAGWITDVPGISRNEALKACGNGVVPQQAEAALRLLLNVSEAAA